MASAALLLAACGESADPGTAPTTGTEDGGAQEPITLQFAWWGNDLRNAYTQELIEIYEAENPHVTIQPEYASFSDYWDRLNTKIAGGDAPDVMQHETRYIREYADRGLLMDLNQFVPDLIEIENIDPAVAETGVVDGNLYALPIGVNAYTVTIDPDVFEQAGVPIPDDETWTWDDWVESAVQISESTDMYGAQLRAGTDGMLDVFSRQRGEGLFTADGEIGTSHETLVDFWSTVMRFHETGAAPGPSETVEIDAGDLEGTVLATGTGASSVMWTNQLPALEAVAGKEFTMIRWPAQTPGGDTGMFLKPSQFWAITEGTDHPEEAARFLDFLLNSPESIEVMLSERGLPANLERREEVLPQLSSADQRAAEFMAEISPELAEAPALPPPGGGEVTPILQRLYEELLFGRITVEEAATQYLEAVEAAIS